MVRATRSDGVIHIRGTPPNLFAALRLTASQAQAISVSLDTPSTIIKKAFELAPPAVHASPVGDMGDASVTRLHLRLPKTTPPGTYHGTMKIEDQTQPIVVEVEPRKRISIFPKRATVCRKAGERAELYLTLINLGNVPLTIPKVSGFGLYNKKGVDLAVGGAFQKKLDKDERRIDSFMEALQDGYGGIVKLKVREGAGTLEPGDSRDVTVDFQVPSQVVPGNEYWGLWSMYDYNYKIEIEVLPDDTKKRKE